MLRARLVLALVVALGGCGAPPADPEASLVGSLRSEPRTFNGLMSVDVVSTLMSDLTQATLVRVDKRTDRVEPWLAESWARSEDGLSYDLTLRRDLRFSDGELLTAADVQFSFQAAYDETAASAAGDLIRVNQQPLQIRLRDPWTIRITFPEPYSPGLRILRSLPILPRHRLESALEAGTLAEAWGLATPVEEITGLGPFVLSAYEPGQRLVFERNPHYWRTDEAGEPLPRLDRLTLEIVPDQNTEMLRFEAGEIDFTQTEVRAEDYPALRRAAEEGRAQLFELGVALDPDFLFFNLNPDSKADDPRQPWLQHDEFRRAVSQAVDRQSFADTVYLGFGEPVHGPVTRSNHRWHNPDVEVFDYDPEAAAKRLDGLGLRDTDGDGVREDAAGEEVRFTLLTHRGFSARERAVAVLADDLSRLGIAVDVVPLEFTALLERWGARDYDALYFGFRASDTDPAANLSLWLSSGSFHFWNPSQPSPATEWEARIDELMAANMSATDEAERVRTFHEVQAILARHLPAIYFAAPRVAMAASSRTAYVDPSLQLPMMLWNADLVGRVD